MLNLLSFAALVVFALLLGYLYTLLLASTRGYRITSKQEGKRLRFAAAIPAHDEAPVIARTISTLLGADYPKDLLDIYVVADHCGDATAQLARQAGAIVLERREGERGGKGPALAWLFQHIFETGQNYQVIAVFDADTLVDRDFFKVMKGRFERGAEVVQGNHIIANPDDGWFPALTRAMFLIDNRCQNLGRANLGWSAKNMGDSICFRADILKRLGWGDGLTEDYQLRQRLILEGIKIAYEPAAKGYGEAAANWTAARSQRARWLSGTYRASRQYASRLLVEGLRRRDGSLLDGAAQAFLPSYSTLTLVSVVVLLGHLAFSSWFAREMIYAWTAVVAALAAYPLLALALERAPGRAFLAILLGPAFILWRTWLSMVARFGKPVVWVRTVRRGERHWHEPAE